MVIIKPIYALLAPSGIRALLTIANALPTLVTFQEKPAAAIVTGRGTARQTPTAAGIAIRVLRIALSRTRTHTGAIKQIHARCTGQAVCIPRPLTGLALLAADLADLPLRIGACGTGRNAASPFQIVGLAADLTVVAAGPHTTGAGPIALNARVEQKALEVAY